MFIFEISSKSSRKLFRILRLMSKRSKEMSPCAARGELGTLSFSILYLIALIICILSHLIDARPWLKLLFKRILTTVLSSLVSMVLIHKWCWLPIIINLMIKFNLLIFNNWRVSRVLIYFCIFDIKFRDLFYYSLIGRALKSRACHILRTFGWLFWIKLHSWIFFG